MINNLEKMNMTHMFKLLIFFATSVFACNVVHAASEIIGFNNMKAAVFENDAFGSGYEEGSYHFGPINIPGVFSQHIHGEDTDGDSEKELNYHADAGGWIGRRIDNTSFNLVRWNMTTLGDQQGDFTNDLIVKGSNGIIFKITQASQPASAGQSIDFGGVFDNITFFEVYFDGQRGIIPVPNSPADGFFASVDEMVLSQSGPDLDPDPDPETIGRIPVPLLFFLFDL